MVNLFFLVIMKMRLLLHSGFGSRFAIDSLHVLKLKGNLNLFILVAK